MSAIETASLSLVEGSSADLADIMAVMSESFDPHFGEAWTAAQCLGILDLPGVWITLARSGEAPAGFALHRMIYDEAELLLLAVRPLLRRSGVGAALLERAMTAAAALGATRLHLEMREGNDAMALYSRNGFTVIGRRPAYYRGKDGKLFDALTLACSLEVK